MRPTFVTHYNVDLLEQNYTRWKEDPDSVDSQWRAFFEGFEFGSAQQPANGAAHVRSDTDYAPPSTTVDTSTALQTKVDSLVYAYRTLGHTIAKIDPLGEPRPDQPLLELSELGFSEADLDLLVSSKFYLGNAEMPLRDMIASLQERYCDTIGAEFMHIQNTRIRNWVRDRIENRPRMADFPVETKKLLLHHLMEAEIFERFLHTRYIGQKRFSLEGGENVMVILETLLEKCPSLGIQEIAMGMAHRGRLNVLTNFLRKSYHAMFTEFSENWVPDLVAGDGDVKYHLGYETIRTTQEGSEVRVSLAANPSHLEAVNPVVQGKARARQRILQDSSNRKKVVPILLHGDAAFAGQGIVAEVLNFSQLPGYRTGGTVHVIINNQIGFTTLPADARSTQYCTDVAKMIEAPIFHVNGDDPIAAAFVAELALEFRQTFAADVVIDMYCYRRHGHNEGDEPAFTQPNLYKIIENKKSVATLFRDALIEEGTLSQSEADTLLKEFETALDSNQKEVKEAEERAKENGRTAFIESTAIFQPPYSHDPVETAIAPATLSQIVDALTTVPPNFGVQRKIQRMLLDRRRRIFNDGGPYDWAFAEALAFGSLLLEGSPVRLSGQDSRRGTFSQRHSVLYDAKTRERYIPLLNLSPDQAKFCVYNSLLSEAAVLGFDYGYSLDYPSMLCIWEAQFGDFANGAQVIIDQFITSAESKWQRPSGLVMLLPHGYEGQGPEHSSARMERFLQLCAEDNIQVCNCTTPAQYFHLLRRQMHRPFRKPLIVMTPKSLLRSELAVSSQEDFTTGRFEEILDDQTVKEPSEVERVIVCSGKVYYDLAMFRESESVSNTALIRLEQLYPVNDAKIRGVLERYANAEHWVWCQEESQNMGAWSFIEPVLERLIGVRFRYAGRDRSSSPAVGSLAVHKREQAQLVSDAFS